ncbi:MAG: hypothetical protein WDN06_22575 [Asticcacaulis sp.]
MHAFCKVYAPTWNIEDGIPDALIFTLWFTGGHRRHAGDPRRVLLSVAGHQA